MNEKRLTTSWMWTFNGDYRGLRFDIDDGILYWYNNLECQCADDGTFAEQTISEFERLGEPGGIGVLPAEVQEQLSQTLTSLK